MGTKIKSLTIISRPGTQQYHIGHDYNGMILDRIEDHTIDVNEDTQIFVPFYKGFCGDDLVFEAINAPVDIQYEKE